MSARSESSSSSSSWSIGVKTVGGLAGRWGSSNHQNDKDEAENQQVLGGGEQDDYFTVRVHPDDDLRCLHNQIEGITGLKTWQQRLIYRGRLISGGGKSDKSNATAAAASRDDSHDVHEQGHDETLTSVETTTHAPQEKKEPKVRDVIGLCDGQTIHLVPRRGGMTGSEDADDDQAGRDGTTASSNNEQNASLSETDNTATLSSDSTSVVGRSLLATLLGLGSLDDDDDNDDRRDDADDDDDTASMSSPSLRRLRSTASSRSANRGSRRRTNSHRLTESDLVVPDPGTMEPVRQGLLTLHTMLDTVTDETMTGEGGGRLQPWEANRQWYRGQWVDCRDTVNQWLEATIVDIAHPDDILPERTLEAVRATCSRPTSASPATDDAVSAHDYEGRRHLLLERDGQGGYRERENNYGVHLLLIHYNGWPHRWDEWIRSDSERLRPFRTRTRHNTSSGAALPTPQSVFDGAPPTSIKQDEEDEQEDRVALLPELSRAMSSVNGILEQVVVSSRYGGESSAEQRSNSVPTRPSSSTSDLPWLAADASGSSTAGWSPENGGPCYSRRQLELLAPLLDRLGRALTDAAPHVASLASTLPQDDDEAFPNESMTDPENNVVVVGESSNDGEEVAPPSQEERRSLSGSGFFSLLSRDNRARTNAVARERENSRISARLDDTIREEERLEVPSPPRDPDYVDFVNGMVNTTRGDIRSGPASRRSASDDGASLLGAYLALSSLASATEGESSNGGGGGGILSRLLRDRGNTGTNDGNAGGPGIDIHIHAIVTGPAVGPGGGLGMAMMAGAPPLTNTVNAAPTTNTVSRGGLFSSRRGTGGGAGTDRVAPSTANEDDMGIFDDLYSENPSPLDPHDGAVVTDGTSDVDGGSAFASVTSDHLHEGAENDGAASTSHSSSLGSRQMHESPSRQTTVSSPQGRRSSPRRRSSLGRVFRNVIGQGGRRRNGNAQESDSESHHYTDE